MKNKKILTSGAVSAFALAAFSGMLTGTSAHALDTGIQTSRTSQVALSGTQASGATEDAGKHDCKGKNECKGQGGCQGSDNGCNGKNSCKGKGGCSTAG